MLHLVANDLWYLYSIIYWSHFISRFYVIITVLLIHEAADVFSPFHPNYYIIVLIVAVNYTMYKPDVKGMFWRCTLSFAFVLTFGQSLNFVLTAAMLQKKLCLYLTLYGLFVTVL